MQVTRVAEAPEYEAPRHFRMATLRLQGAEASAADAFTVGLSHALPAGGAELGAAPVERVYVVVAGELYVSAGGQEAVLGPLDSCYLPAGEERLIENRTNLPTTFLVVMARREES